MFSPFEFPATDIYFVQSSYGNTSCGVLSLGIEIRWIFTEELFEIKVVYMCSSLLQLAPGSCDLYQAEKMITVM